jgi:hypothetical protein
MPSYVPEEQLMATLTVPDAIYQKLAQRAAALNTTAEALAGPVLARLAMEAEPGAESAEPQRAALPANEWQAIFDKLLAEARDRAGRYPPGFQADVSRESIYEGCGE